MSIILSQRYYGYFLIRRLWQEKVFCNRKTHLNRVVAISVDSMVGNETEISRESPQGIQSDGAFNYT